MLSIGRVFAGEGWRYLWEQVAGGAEDYYLAGVAAGELPGRWGGAAAGPELGLSGEVTEDQMRRLFGELADPTSGASLGNPPRTFRPVEERLAAARSRHDEDTARWWAARQLTLAENGPAGSEIEAEEASFRSEATEAWTVIEARVRRGGERQAVAGLDLTFSPPKSVSVLWAAAPTVGAREAIWRAHREGVEAAIAFVEREAGWSRTGYNGVCQVDTTGLVTAAFDHRMSRTGDVQIHTHVATLNRVRCADGEWRTLDSRAVYRAAAAAGALYDATREAALHRELGVRHAQRRPGGPREIVGVDDDVLRLFSSRRTQIEGRLADLVTAWKDRHGGSGPSPWVVSQLSAWATLQTRPRKEGAETTAEALARWETQTCQQLGKSLRRVWDQATQAGETSPPEQDGPIDDGELVAAAVQAVDTAKSTWTRYDLAREITRRLPTDPTLDIAGQLARVDRLVNVALAPANPCGVLDLTPRPVFDTPSELRRRGDGESVYVPHGHARYTTRAGLAAEHRLLHAAGDRSAPRLPTPVVDEAVTDAGMDADQAAAARAVLGSGRRLDVLVGPAGAGKTTTMRAVAAAWVATGREVLGVAVAETAARVLAQAAGVRAVNAAKLIYEHTERPPEDQQRPWWQEYRINPGTLVIFDEAAMASRDTIDTLARITLQADAKLLLVGDHEQLESPDAAGAFELTAGIVGVGLGTVRRFLHPWEATASLRLRSGDPAVLDDYDRRGRIHGGTDTDMENAALAATLADQARGLTAYLLADTNETAARLAGRIRAHLVATGTVDDHTTITLTDGNRAGPGDRIVTRDNDRSTATSDGRFVANRDIWEVCQVTRHGGLLVTRVPTHQQAKAAPPRTRPDVVEVVELDADYAAANIQLAYAATVHAAQGADGDTSHVVLTGATSRHALYTALTRGTEENHAYVVTTREEGLDTTIGPADPLAVLADILERDDPPERASALTTQADLAEREHSTARLFPIWQDLTTNRTTHQAHAALTAAGSADLAAATLASPTWPALAARLRRIEIAGTNPAAALAAAVSQRSLEDVDDFAAVLHWRLHTHDHHTPPASTAL